MSPAPRKPDPLQRFIRTMGEQLLTDGFTRKGRSRVWLKDLGWWVTAVELQPSSWSKGSYLNVGTMFLLLPSDSGDPKAIAFYSGPYRVLPFHPIETEEQADQAIKRFRPAIKKEVRREEKRYGAAGRSAAEILKDRPSTLHKQYVASLLYAITGNSERAILTLDRALDNRATKDWILRLNAHLTALRAVAECPATSTDLALNNIRAARDQLGLPAVSDARIRESLGLPQP